MKAEDITEAETLEMIYDKIAKRGDYTVFTPSIEAAKDCVKTYVRINRKLNLPIEFIRKGKYVIVVLKGRGDLIRKIPDSSHAVEILMLVRFGGEDARKRILQSRALGVEPKITMNCKEGKIEVQYAKGVN